MSITLFNNADDAKKDYLVSMGMSHPTWEMPIMNEKDAQPTEQNDEWIQQPEPVQVEGRKRKRWGAGKGKSKHAKVPLVTYPLPTRRNLEGEMESISSYASPTQTDPAQLIIQ